MVHVSTPAGGRREERRQQTTAAIVDAALAQVEGEGFEALTMQRLAHELGFAVGALYRYFPSKDALLLAVQRRVVEQLGDDVTLALSRVDAHARRARLSSSSSSLLRLLAAVQTYRALPGRRPHHFAMLSRWLGDPRPLVDTAAALPHVPALLALLHPVAGLIDDAVDAGALAPGPSERRLVVLWGALQGVLQLQKLARFGVAALETDPLVDELTRALCRGWGADPPLVDDVLRRLSRLDLSSNAEHA